MARRAGLSDLRGTAGRGADHSVMRRRQGKPGRRYFKGQGLLARLRERSMRKMRSLDEVIIEQLKANPAEAALYLTVCAEENDPAVMLSALSQVARAHGKSKLANKISLSRMGLHKALSKN